ncbi:MAG: asparagine--tRNA ligase [Bacteroidetes bacterium]|nr:asparagine--tRNA ligase [Bacteroidota bacterium]
MQYIKDLADLEGKEISLKGWVSNTRSGKGLVFLVFRDGTGFTQCVINETEVEASTFEAASSLTLESSLELSGTVVKDERQIGGYEIHVKILKVIQLAVDYPISKKEHGVDFLMDMRHLWLRSRRQWAIMRIRNQIIMAIHRFLQDKDFIQMDSPIFTGNVVEGTSTLFETDFYGQPAYLSQSGQLYGEAMAMSLSKIYTFGPTFRAEKSKTRRHLSEFWMIEPEMAFYDNEQNMDLIEEFIKSLLTDILEKCQFELEIIKRDVSKLEKAKQEFPRMTYDKAVTIIKGEEEVDGKNAITTLEDDLEEAKKELEEALAEIKEREDKVAGGGIKKGEVNFNLNKIGTLKASSKELEEKISNIPQWIDSAKNFEYGSDFGGSDETVLTRLFDMPIMVYNWPAPIKAFYMKEVEGNPKLVKGVDVLAPEGFGEIVGGGERETSEELLTSKIIEHKLPKEAFEWYIDLRRYGSVTHAGFGLGLERTVAWICGLHHVRESIPLPRMYGRLFP